jgi:2-methylcitrate dehydratase PrpD
MSTPNARDACALHTEALCRWAAGTTLADIPDAVLDRALRVLADDLAAIVGAAHEPEVACFHEKVLARSSTQEATVFCGGRRRTERTWAAVANAMAADWLELDEGYRLAPCHAGLYTVPALLAEGEAINLRVGEMLRALVLGYEVVTRVARAFTQRTLNMQAHGRYCAIGAAAATALARGAAAELLQGAITAATTLVTASPRNHLVSGALVRNVWPATGAFSGMLSVEWAQCGITGVATGLYDVYDSVFGSEVDATRLTDDLGTRWAIQDGYTKVFACCQHLHSAVEAALGMRAALEDKGGPAAIEGIEVETHPLALPLANASPTTSLGAKFSMPHAVAATLATGTGGAEAFFASTLSEQTIAGLREKVRIHPYEPLPSPPDDRPARVRIRLRSGSVIENECSSAQGGPDRPFPDSVLDDKVRMLTERTYPNLAPTLLEFTGAALARREVGWADLVARMIAR